MTPPSIELRDAPGRPESPFYKAVAITPPGRTVYVAGQTGSDEDGVLVEGGLAAQAQRAMDNVGLALDAAGATAADLAKLTIYVVDWEPAKLEQLGAGLLAARETRPWPPVPATLIGVAALFEPGHLVEIDATAVIAD